MCVTHWPVCDLCSGSFVNSVLRVFAMLIIVSDPPILDLVVIPEIHKRCYRVTFLNIFLSALSLGHYSSLEFTFQSSQFCCVSLFGLFWGPTSRRRERKRTNGDWPQPLGITLPVMDWKIPLLQSFHSVWPSIPGKLLIAQSCLTLLWPCGL